ncbi:hypothetical protein KR093_009649 [Drosophila rubida]|uniref:Uncharacterized protein n=1 Tax=Drosophila rubida TaxID=30044 RepID=A0AAD4PPX8_9MUSC|nr:hypothetical protein KR093_009649 [Drosophila rubida]
MPEIRKQQCPVGGMGLARPPKPIKSPQEKRIALITAMGHFRPKNATPIQFYNYVREFCIMHNCSIDEAMERAPPAWSQLSMDQRQLYNSEMHAALPIPVPRHLVYRAIQMERAGRWKLEKVVAGKGGSPMYSVESYAPPMKPTRLQTRLRAQQPRFDNLAETSPCCLDAPGAPGSRHSNVPRKLRTLTPPEQRAQRAQLEKPPCCLASILSEVSLKRVPSEEGGDKTYPAADSDGDAQTASAADADINAAAHGHDGEGDGECNVKADASSKLGGKLMRPLTKCLRKQGKRKSKKTLQADGEKKQLKKRQPKQQTLVETAARPDLKRQHASKKQKKSEKF